MNKQCHKVIFNKTTGRMDVVSEIVSAQGGATLASANEHPNPAWHHSITQFLIKPVAFALMLSLGTAQILPAQAQVIADPSAPKSQQPTVLPTASGATQINIQTPSAAGVSMNQYKQFDTQTNGTVLNNSRTNTNTQTAGWIQANPWLATGSARVIVNQVNSSNPSRLTGNIEVAGQRADLIIANPSGININGAAIINAKRTTFTTGAPQLNNGNLTAYQVNQGQINIEGTGLNATGSDYTDLLARAVKVNAGIWANNLAITTGANNINATNDNITPSSQVTANTSTTPSLAIDTSALGGMYAGKITLIGTENGVGVNNAGQIAASAGNVTIDANGMLSNSGTINANLGADGTANTQIQSTSLTNTGSISSQGNTQIQTAGLTNSGTIAAGREAKLTATELNNSTGTINGQRIDITANSLNNTQGKIQQTGTQALALNAGSISNLNNGLIGYEPLDSGSGTGSTGTGTGSTGTGTTTPPSTATGGGSSTVVQPTPVVLADGQINVQTSLNNDAGRITANGGIDLTASNGLENHATLSLNKLTVTGDRLDNSSGTITSTQLTANTTNINNTSGKMGASGDVALISNNLTNSAGQITAGGTLNAQIAGVVLNDNGVLASAGQQTLNANSIDNSSGQIASSAASVTVQSNGTVNNTQGTIQSLTTTQLTSTAVNNTDGIIDGGTVAVNTQGQTLNNTRGHINGDSTDISSGTLSNDAGLIQGTHSVTINTHAQALTNTNSGTTGGIVSGGTLDIHSGDVSNAAGSIQAQSTLDLSSTALNNTNGKINASTTHIDTQGQTLNNTNGQINSDTLSLNSGALNNDAGLIQGTQGVDINTHGQTLINANSGTQGGIVSGGSLTVLSGNMGNSGYMGSTGAATLSTAQLNNSGTIDSANTLYITATGVDNRGGQIEAVGNASISVGSGSINNDGSLIRSGATTTLNAASVINSNTSTTGTGIEGAGVSLNANNIDNSAGAIRADKLLDINSSGVVNNTNGLITSAETVAIKDPNAPKTLSVINTDGTIIAGTDNTIDAKSITGDGKLLSNQDMSIVLTDDLTNSATIQAANNLSLSSAGTITNMAKIIAVNANTVTAQSVDNTATAEISGTQTTIKAIDSVTNRGLVDGTNTLITTQNINNIGTGRIYGDHLSIGATTLNNIQETVGSTPTAATIAARERLDIGAGTINNLEHGTLFSGNTMNIGGALDVSNNATGQANTVNNASATIESIGDMKLSAGQINNTNEHLTTSFPLVSSNYIQTIQFSNRSSGEHGPGYLGWNLGDIYPGVYDRSNYQFNGIKNISEQDANGVWQNLGRIWIENNYTEDIYQTRVDTTDPGRITSGGSMSVSGNLFNKDSTLIAGGVYTQASGTLTNDSTDGTTLVKQKGQSINRDWYDEGGIFGGGYTREDLYTSINKSISSIFELPTTVFQQNTAPTASGITIGTLNTGSVTDKGTGAGATSVNINKGSNSIASVSAVNTTDPTLIKTGAVNTQMPNSSLFTVNPNNSGYYIQTDPRFANYRNWLSSDWMLNALNLDPANMHKRLGDGYYEQKLIKEQIAQLTGRRYLGDYHNDDTQYQALMNAGVTFAGQYNLRPGVALTAEQMARLTSDIVWLVEQEVTLPDGSTVTALVPKIYVAVKPSDLLPTGALISANSMDLKLTGDLHNSGTIAGRNVVQINAQNLNNLGTIAGNQLNLNATNDLNNMGGVLQANTSAILQAGHDVNVQTTTRTTTGSTSTGSNFGNTIIDRVAGIYVGDGSTDTSTTSLLVRAGNDVNLNAAVIHNAGQGNSAIIAQNNVNLGAVKTQTTDNKVWDAQNYRKQTITTDVGSSINTTGNLLISGNNISAVATDINSETGQTVLKASKDINLIAGKTTDQYSDKSHSESSGLLSSSQHDQNSTHNTSDSIASNVTGAKVLIDAGKDINITGSNVVSDTQTTLTAGNDLNITAAQNTHSSTHFEQTKESGLMGTGGIGFMIGSKQNSIDDTNTHITHTGSMVASNQGDVRISAGDTLNVKGSDIQAHDDLSAIAQTINITAETNRYTQATEQKSKSSGLTVNLGGTIGNAANGVIAAVQQGNSANDRGNDRLAAAYDTKATLIAAQAAQSVNKDVTDISDANKATQGPIIGVSVSVGSSRSQSNSASQTTVAQGSNLTAGNHLSLTATGDGTKGADGYANNGDLNIQGSSVSAAVVDLNAARDVNLTSATNTNTETSSNNSSGWAVGANIGVSASGSMGISVFANANKGKGNANGNGVTHTETQINASDTLNVNSGRDANLIGAQAHGNTVNADIGRDLTITSEQDSSNYNSKQTNMSAGVEIPVYGVGSASASFNMSKQKIDSNYNSVNEQSGIYAGEGGFNVKVNGHTQLNAGAIVSEAPKDKNTLNTGSLGVTQLDNHAQYTANNSGIGISTGNLTDIAKGALMAQIPQALNGGEDASSTTQSAISPANVTIGGKAATAEQLKDVATTANANSLATIFDVQAVQDQMELASTVGDVGALATNVVSTAMQRSEYVKRDEALKAAEDNLKATDPVAWQTYQAHPSAQALVDIEFNQALQTNPVLKAEYEALPKDKQDTFVQDQINQGKGFGAVSSAEAAWHQTQNQYGPGSDFSRTAQALSGLAAGLAMGNTGQALSNLSQPFLASAIGTYFDNLERQPDGTMSHEYAPERLLAHAAAGAVVAYFSGNNAASGATGAVSGEAIAMIVHDQLYDNKPTSELTIAEKENIRAIATLAAGLAGALQGGSFETAATSAAAGYNAAVNNDLTDKVINHLKSVIDDVSSGKASGTATADGTLVAGLGITTATGVAFSTDGKACQVTQICGLAGPMVGGFSNGTASLSPGRVTPGSTSWSVSGVGKAAVVVGGGVELGWGSNGPEVSISGGLGGGLGGAIKVCKQIVSTTCN